jgi:hypothetical protein
MLYNYVNKIDQRIDHDFTRLTKLVSPSLDTYNIVYYFHKFNLELI